MSEEEKYVAKKLMALAGFDLTSTNNIECFD